MEAVKAAIAEGADISTVPVVFDTAPDMKRLTVALYKQNLSEKVDVMGLAVLVKRILKDNEGDQKATAEEFGIDPRYVDQLDKLLGATKYVREAIKADRIAASEVMRLQTTKKGKDPKVLEELVKAQIANAEKDGARKATRKHAVDDATKKKNSMKETAEKAEDEDEDEDDEVAAAAVKMVKEPFEYSVEKDKPFRLVEIAPVAKLIGDSNWYIVDEDRAGWATPLETLRIVGAVYRTKKEETAPDAKEDPEDDTDEEEEGEDTPKKEDEDDTGGL